MRGQGGALTRVAVAAMVMLALLLWAWSCAAQAAPCIANWPSDQPTTAGQRQQYLHKAIHFAGEAGITAGAGQVARSIWPALDASAAMMWGVAAGTAALIGRELYKAATPGMACEWSSVAFGAAGIAAGAIVGYQWLIYPTRGGAGMRVSVPLQ